MFCKHCGKIIPDGSAFCPACGAQLVGARQPQPAPVQTAPQVRTSGGVGRNVAVFLATLLIAGGVAFGVLVGTGMIDLTSFLGKNEPPAAEPAPAAAHEEETQDEEQSAPADAEPAQESAGEDAEQPERVQQTQPQEPSVSETAPAMEVADPKAFVPTFMDNNWQAFVYEYDEAGYPLARTMTLDYGNGEKYRQEQAYTWTTVSESYAEAKIEERWYDGSGKLLQTAENCYLRLSADEQGRVTAVSWRMMSPASGDHALAYFEPSVTIEYAPYDEVKQATVSYPGSESRTILFNRSGYPREVYDTSGGRRDLVQLFEFEVKADGFSYFTNHNLREGGGWYRTEIERNEKGAIIKATEYEVANDAIVESSKFEYAPQYRGIAEPGLYARSLFVPDYRGFLWVTGCPMNGWIY